LSVLTKDEHIVIAVVSVYASFFGLYKIKSAFSAKPPVPAAPVAVAVASSGATSKWGFDPPTLDNIDEWSANEENWKKWEDFMGGPLLEKWANSLE